MSNEAETRFRALAAAVDDLVFITAPTGQMYWCNQTFREQTGFSTEDFQFPNPDNPFLHPDDAERVAGALAELAASEDDRIDVIENRFFDRWGRVRTFRSSISKVRWEGNDAFQIVTRPIDPKSEESRTNLETFRYLVESADDGILKLAVDGRFHFTNQGFQTLVQRDSVALGKLTFFDVVHPADREAAELALSQPDAVEPTASCIVRLLVAGQTTEPRWVSVKTRRLTDGNDTGLILALVRDITEARRLEARTRQSQKLESLGLLAGGIAHDFNNLVTGILANASLAQQLAPATGPLAEVLRALRDAGVRAGAVTSSLLTYVGQRPADLRAVDLGEIVEAGAESARSAAREGVTLDVSSEGSFVVRADPVQLTQVVMNLVTNALQATEAGGVVVEIGEPQIHPRNWSGGGDAEEDALPDGPTVSIRVRDEGGGMSPETIRKIFDPFYTTKGIGRGLGLSSVLGIVRAHGGVVAVQSEVGAGSVFEVILPVVDAKPTDVTPSEPIEPQRGSGVVLFIDDEPTIRNVAKVILERHGYDAVLKENGQRAMDAFQDDPESFRVVVVDHTMPGMSGAQVIEALRALRPRVPIVHASGYRDVAADVADVVFLPKPYDAGALIAAIRKAISRQE